MVTNNLKNIKKIIENFKFFKISDFVIISEQKNEIHAIIPNLFSKDEFLTFKSNFKPPKNLSKLLFPDKLKNLHGSTLKITFADSMETLINHDRTTLDKLMNFLAIIKQKMNATLDFIEIAQLWYERGPLWEAVREDLSKIYHKIDMHMWTQPNNLIGVINYYEKEKICLLVPYPPKISIIDQILFRPLEREVWMYLGISIGVTAIVWRLHRNYGANDSTGNFLFGIFSFFVGQSAEFKT